MGYPRSLRIRERSSGGVSRGHVVPGVSPSGYDAWRPRQPSARARADAALRTRIKAIHARSRATYGVPRSHAELTDEGVGVKRIARLMQAPGLVGVSRHQRTHTTRRRDDARPAPDRVERDFGAPRPDRL